MKRKTILLMLALVAFCTAHAQKPDSAVVADPMKGDTAIAAAIINNYLAYVNFNHLLKDSIVYVRSTIVERSHPTDTIVILRWYGNNRKERIEMWQNGKMEDAYYSDGKKLFRRFSKSFRTWRDMTQYSYYDHTIPLDIRGALYDWRSKGSEAYFVGQYTYNDHPVYRVFVTSPKIYDRNYFFERETGLLFLVKEENHIFGDDAPVFDSKPVDWRAWHEFTPFNGCLLPTIESYQIDDQLYVIHNSYSMRPLNDSYFTQNIYTP